MLFSDSAQNVLATYHDIIQLHEHLYVYLISVAYIYTCMFMLDCTFSLEGMLMMRKQLMTRKSLDGSISMVMSSGSQRISHYFLLLLAQELNYLPCKLLWLFSLSL